MKDHSSVFLRSAISMTLATTGLSLAMPANAQGRVGELEEVVVTGFRGSLNTALAEKRNATAAIDVIASEDVGNFPDSNLSPNPCSASRASRCRAANTNSLAQGGVDLPYCTPIGG